MDSRDTHEGWTYIHTCIDTDKHSYTFKAVNINSFFNDTQQDSELFSYRMAVVITLVFGLVEYY